MADIMATLIRHRSAYEKERDRIWDQHGHSQYYKDLNERYHRLNRAVSELACEYVSPPEKE